MSGTQQAASHVHHAGSRASDVAPRQFYVTTRGSCLHLQSRASYRWRQFWKAPRDLCLQPFSIYPAWADEDQIQASSRQGLWKTTVPKPSARPRGEQKTAHPPCKTYRFRGHTRAAPQKAGIVELEVARDWRLHVAGGCMWLEGARGWRVHAVGGCERWAACGRRLCAATPRMMGRARLEAIRDGPVDDRPRAVGGYARLELMHGFEIWGVGGPSFPQVEASTKWSL